MTALPIALAFVGAMGAFGFWTVFLAQDSIRRAAPHSTPVPAERERSRATVVAPASRFHPVDEPRSAPRAVTRVAIVVLAALIVVSALAGPRPPTRAS
jgi:hypothetical protein